MSGTWIWLEGVKEQENQRGCFAAFFKKGKGCGETVLRISASARYTAYLNGKEIGRGPIRSDRKTGYYDCYCLEPELLEENMLSVHVWSYGWSTYQSLAAPGGLWFEIRKGEELLQASGKDTLGALDLGHQWNAPKRNVNLGFGDYYDGEKFESRWMERKEFCEGFPKAKEISTVFEKLEENPLKDFTAADVYPKSVETLQTVKRGCQQLTINTRRAFFGDRRDADETIFSGFLGFCLESPEDMEGRIAFPNRTWNGLLGDFCIDGKLYPVSNADRDIPVTLRKGCQFFLLQLSGKFDDLYCHMEFVFPQEIRLHSLNGGEIFVAGPTQRILPVLDGRSRIYGGLKEFNRMEEETEAHKRIFQAISFEEVKECCQRNAIPLRFVDPFDYGWNQYLLSLARTAQVLEEQDVSSDNLGILWNNYRDTVIPLPGGYLGKRLILDFGDLYVGNFEFLIKAPAGTVMDGYCYENQYGGEVDYTIGLNNGFRYRCKEGWQKYSVMARMGVRFCMLTFYGTEGEIRIRDFHIRHRVYAGAGIGRFQCQDEKMNRIFEMCRHTHRLCMEDSFTDCPTYEQAFWIGDAQLTSKINTYVSGDYELIRRNLELAVTAGENTKLYNALTPTDWNTNIPMWTMNWIISIGQYLEVTGEETILEKLYPKVKEVLEYYEDLILDDGAFLISAWNMMDWADMDIDNEAVVTGQQGILGYCYKLAAQFAERLGDETAGRAFREIRKRLLRYIDEKLWDQEKQCYLDGWMPGVGFSATKSIQTHVFLYLYDAILSGEKRKKTENYLIDPPDDFVKAGSPFMLYYYYECLIRLGREESVLEDIKERWGEMLHYDSTTCWEVFPGFYENSRTRSYCHSWSAAPVIFMLEQTLGIQREDEGFRKIRLKEPTGGGGWCRGSMPTPYGRIKAQWERKKKRYTLWLPDAIEADISRLPGWQVEIQKYSNKI